MNVFDTSSYSYKIAVESFNEMAMDQTAGSRMNYRSAAMEAIAGPDSGMVLDRLYKSVMSRASINFGKIPGSMGDLTKFTKYKSMADSLSLLHRSLDEYNIPELALTQELHDSIIRCRDDFAYGFKVDSQFLKTTYNTMVFSLCEMINLCSVIYIDMLKAGAEGRSFTYEGYQDLILVQNVQKFVNMVKSGEWSRMATGIKKDARNLLDVVFAPQETGGDSSASVMSQLKAPVGIFGIWAAASTPYAKMAAKQRVASTVAGSTYGPFTAEQAAKISSAKVGWKDIGTGMKMLAGKVWKSLPGRVLIIVLAIVAVLMLLRAIIMLYYKGKYALRDILEDNERFLRFHMEHKESDPSGTSKSLEKQKAMYEALSGLRNRIEQSILASDNEARKELKKANATEFTADAFQPDAPTPPMDDVVIG